MDTCRPHIKKLEIMTLTSIYIFEMSKFVRNHPDIFDKSLYNRRYTPRTNNLNKYKLPNSRLAMFSSSPYCNALKIHNHLPNSLRSETNINTFKKKLKALLIEKCYYNMQEFFSDNLSLI